jgi:[acyl-carrier-protein] S-malonyltransferase
MAGAFGDVLFVEMGPGNVLTGLGGRIVPGARGIACGTPADIDRLLTQLTQ